MKSKNKQVRLLIAVPSGSEVKTDFALSVAMLTTDLCFPIPGVQHQFDLAFMQGSQVAQQRQMLVKRALENDATHLLFLDSDMTFPSNTFRRLLHWNKDIVACNCTTRRLPPEPTARLDAGDSYGKVVYQSPEAKGLLEVWRVGTAVMLINVDVFRKIPMPHFPMEWNEDWKAYQGEDWSFCEAAQKAGYSVFIDQELSNEIGHVGQFIFEHRYVEVENG